MYARFSTFISSSCGGDDQTIKHALTPSSCGGDDQTIKHALTPSSCGGDDQTRTHSIVLWGETIKRADIHSLLSGAEFNLRVYVRACVRARACKCVCVCARARILAKYEMYTPRAHLKKGALRPHYYILLIGGHSPFDIFQQCDCNVFMALNVHKTLIHFNRGKVVRESSLQAFTGPQTRARPPPEQYILIKMAGNQPGRENVCRLLCTDCFQSLAGAATSIIFVATKDVFCRNKHVFVATKVSSSRHNVCRGKNMFVATSIPLPRQKTCFVATNTCLSR